MSAAHTVGVLLHRLLHPQGRVARAHGVVLMGQGRAEQRHDAVAHHLVDGALVPVHGLHHVIEHRIEERAGLLGIALDEQLHRALEIGEEHRDLLALALQRAPGGEDLLGEVLRRIDARRAPDHRPTAEPLPTAATEPTARWVEVAAGCACHLEPGAATIAEARPGGIHVLARRASHGPRLALVCRGIKPACRGRASAPVAARATSWCSRGGWSIQGAPAGRRAPRRARRPRLLPSRDSNFSREASAEPVRRMLNSVSPGTARRSAVEQRLALGENRAGQAIVPRQAFLHLRPRPHDHVDADRKAAR